MRIRKRLASVSTVITLIVFSVEGFAKTEIESFSPETGLANHKPLTSDLKAPANELASNQPAMKPLRDLGSISPYTAADGISGTPRNVVLELSMHPQDGRVSSALKHYLERNGWQLAWEIERDFPIEYPATFTGDFLGIIEQVVLSLQNSDAPIRVKVYEANRVLRVVHATQ